MAAAGKAKDYAKANDNRTYNGKNTNRPDDAADQSTEYGNNIMNTLVSAGAFDTNGNEAIDTRPYGGHQGFQPGSQSRYPNRHPSSRCGREAVRRTDGGRYGYGYEQNPFHCLFGQYFRQAG